MSRLFLLFIAALLATTTVTDAANTRSLRSTDTEEERGLFTNFANQLVGAVNANEQVHKLSSELSGLVKNAKATRDYSSALSKIDDIETKIKAVAGMDVALEKVQKTKFYLWFKMGSVPAGATATEQERFEAFVHTIRLVKQVEKDKKEEAKKIAAAAKHVDGEGHPVAATRGWTVTGVGGF